MGRPRKKKPTIIARMYKHEYDELRSKFPNTDMSDLLSVAYRTSPLKLEAALRKPKNKNGII